MSIETKYRLADFTVAEPLINHWGAWSYLVAPVPASLQLLRHQMPILQSYLEDPDFHVKACLDPALVGGAFMDIPVERINEVRELLAVTLEKQGDALKFASTFIQFYDWLIEAAKGQSLEPFYDKMPDEMRGCVELVYDYYNRPTVRFLENLLYESRYYDKSLQSMRLSRLRRDSRPFIMSTPRLQEKDQIDWRLAFDDSRVDELFKLDIEPQPLHRIREILELKSSDEQKLLPLLSEQAPAHPEPWEEDRVRVKYFGHACLLIQWRGIAILTDPFVAALPSEEGISRLSYGELPGKIDFALITHNHADHFFLESLLRLRHRIECLVVPRSFGILYGDISLKLLAKRLAFKQVVELDSFESIGLADGEIVAIPFLGEHADLAHGKAGYLIRAGKEQILCAADSACLDKRLYEIVRHSLGAIETVFLGVEPVGAPLSWAYGPLLPKRPQYSHDQSRRQRGCDSRAALDILEGVGAKRVYNYGMGREPWLEHILALLSSEDSPQIRESNKLLAQARERGFLTAERPFGKDEFYLDGLN